MSGLDLTAIYVILDDLKASFGNRFIIGLSGGGDSLALTHICSRWAAASGAHVTALCVDHGFRDASKDEARQAQAWAQALGTQARIITNDAPAPKSGFQAFARDLRHKAFGQAAFDVGGATILLGHTLDDQAETIAFRLSRKTGLDGLAGMASVQSGLVNWKGQSYPIARPLLHVRRAALRHYLSDAGQAWIDDPSNENTVFSRVKTRQRLAELGGHETLGRIGDLASALREIQEHHLDQIEPVWICPSTGGLKASFLTLAPNVSARLLRRRLIFAGVRDHHIEARKIDNLHANMATNTFKSATLGGILITRNAVSFRFSKAPQRRASKKLHPLE
jgi:tRNA(Ile)-lysidine synthase